MWPAAALHGFWNLTIRSVFDRSTAGPAAKTRTGEGGILTAATLVVLAIVVAVVAARQTWPILRTPPPSAPSRSTADMGLPAAR